MDISRYAKPERIHHYQTCFAKNVTKKKMLQRNPSGRRKMTVFGNLDLHK